MRLTLRAQGPGGSDSTAPYSVEMSDECTVQEFVECVLKQFPGEWGYIGIRDGSIFGNPNIEYAKGEIITENRLRKTEGETVIRASAHGGWSRMDYLLTIEEGDTE